MYVYIYVYIYVYVYVYIYIYALSDIAQKAFTVDTYGVAMVSKIDKAEYRLFYRALLQKRPII